MRAPLSWLIWALVAIAGAFGFAMIAGIRGEGAQVNAIWMIVAGVCTYSIAVSAHVGMPAARKGDGPATERRA